MNLISLQNLIIYQYHGCSFADKKESRYNPKMHQVISVDNWRKGSQVTHDFVFS